MSFDDKFVSIPKANHEMAEAILSAMSCQPEDPLDVYGASIARDLALVMDLLGMESDG